jgi:phosphoribosylaminoimidazolecarboxamide formyltransferase/IMP cyclohydrolase
VAHYDLAINRYFHPGEQPYASGKGPRVGLRYGENPHQQAFFYGDLSASFTQLHGKEISYNNLVDIEAAIQLISEFNPPKDPETTFAVIKHTNVCGAASRGSLLDSWKAALAADPESAFGGVLVCNAEVDLATAESIQEIFFEVLMAPSFAKGALSILQTKKNRILLQLADHPQPPRMMFKSMLMGVLEQETDEGNFAKWEEAGGRDSEPGEKEDLEFANLVCKHLKSNAIALVRNRQLIGKGCGQTSRVDALRQAIEKSRQFAFSLQGAVLASDAFFPFDDCVRMAHAEGIHAFIQPGGSIRDQDSIAYCKEHGLAMVITGMRHFRH